MKVIYSDGGRCQKTRKYLDYYISDELSIEASLELTGHLAHCQSCLAELQLRMRLKNRLRRAVLQEVVSLRLRERVLKQIRQGI
jgi:anti-sigma factor RsiW